MKLFDIVFDQNLRFLRLSPEERNRILILLFLGAGLSLISVWYVVPKCLVCNKKCEHSFYKFIAVLTVFVCIHWIVAICLIANEIRKVM